VFCRCARITNTDRLSGSTHAIIYLAEEAPELENKEEKRSVGGRQRPEDIVTIYQFGEDDFVVKEPPKFKIPNPYFEQ
jgi:hypothetical protein